MDFSKLLNQTAVYWAPGTSDGEGGISFVAGVEINCRWEDRQMKYIAAQGDTQISRSVIFTSQNVSLRGYLFLGELADLTSPSAAELDPTEEHNAFEIKAFNKIPSVDAMQFERTAIL
jgi:hypothetical protein